MATLETTTEAAKGEKQVLFLESSDKQVFEVDKDAALKSLFIKNMLEDFADSDEATGLKKIAVPHVSGPILSLVTNYCKFHMQQDRKRASARLCDNPGASASASVSTSCILRPATASASAAIDEEIEIFQTSLIADLDHLTLIDLILAANYLDIQGLLDISTQGLANIIQTKTPEQVREIFNIANDLTPEEEEEIRKKNQWAFDD